MLNRTRNLLHAYLPPSPPDHWLIRQTYQKIKGAFRNDTSITGDPILKFNLIENLASV